MKFNFERCYVPANGEIVAGCIDGRCGCDNHYPNSAGGTLSLFIAARLNNQTNAGWPTFLAKISNASLPLSFHIDEHANSSKSGCGANDQLEGILKTLADDFVRQSIITQMKAVEISVNKDILDKIGQAAVNMILDTPTQRLEAIKQTGAKIDKLVGSHREEEILINLVPNTTLDRTNSNGKAFNVDVWAFESSARATLEAIGQAADQDATEKFVTALIAFNLATGMVLNPDAKIKIQRG